MRKRSKDVVAIGMEPKTKGDRDRLLEVLMAAFGGLPCPKRFHFRSNSPSGDPVEIARVEEVLLGKRWQDYVDRPLELVGGMCGRAASVWFMSPITLQYYLPAFLLASAFHNDKRQAEDVMSGLVSLFTPTEESRNRLMERWSILTLPQIDATIAALKIVDARYGETSYADDIGPAIEFLTSLRDSAPRS